MLVEIALPPPGGGSHAHGRGGVVAALASHHPPGSAYHAPRIERALAATVGRGATVEIGHVTVPLDPPGPAGARQAEPLRKELTAAGEVATTGPRIRWSDAGARQEPRALRRLVLAHVDQEPGEVTGICPESRGLCLLLRGQFGSDPGTLCQTVGLCGVGALHGPLLDADTGSLVVSHDLRVRVDDRPPPVTNGSAAGERNLGEVAELVEVVAHDGPDLTPQPLVPALVARNHGLAGHGQRLGFPHGVRARPGGSGGDLLCDARLQRRDRGAGLQRPAHPDDGLATEPRAPGCLGAKVSLDLVEPGSDGRVNG